MFHLNRLSIKSAAFYLRPHTKTTQSCCYSAVLVCFGRFLRSVFCLPPPPLPPLATGIAVTGDASRPRDERHPGEKPRTAPGFYLFSSDEDRNRRPSDRPHLAREPNPGVSPLYPLPPPLRDLTLGPHPVTEHETQAWRFKPPEITSAGVVEVRLITSTRTGNKYLTSIFKMHQK